MRRWLAITVVAGAVLLAACTPHAGPRSAPASPARTGSARYLPLADCPVTHGVPGIRPPRALQYQPPPVPYVHDWYGNQVIWVMLPIGGRLPAQPDPAPGWSGRLSTKFPWYGMRLGQFHATTQRLDGPGRFDAGFGSVGQGYGPPGFAPSALYWSSPGCWRLTATLGGGSLSFTVRVYPI